MTISNSFSTLLPAPQKVTRGRGVFDLADAIVQLDGSCSKSVSIRHKLKTLELKPTVGDLGSFTCLIGSPNLARLRPPQKAEGYVLRCDADGVAIRGFDLDGLYWGLVTLEQLLVGGTTVPCGEIRDYPAFSLRYHHDDISRKQVSTLADFKRMIRLLSNYKIKYYTPYIEDMLFLKSFPDIGEGRGRLTVNEVKGLLAEAKRYNVTVFPTFSLIGHQENLLQNPVYKKYGREVFQSSSSFDPSKKILRPFLRKVIADVCELFPDAPIFHAGFDETQGIEGDEFIEHANWCAGEIAKHGKQMMMWVDMFKNHYGLKRIHELAENVIPVEWDYDNPGIVEQDYIDAKVIPTGLSGYRCNRLFLPDFNQSKLTTTRWASLMKRWGGAGFGCSIWGDDNGYENSRDLCWNLYAFNGEVAWRGRRGSKDFEHRFQLGFYGESLPALTGIIEELPRKRKLPPRKAWRMFRVPQSGLMRLVVHEKGLIRQARHDKALFEKALRSLNGCRKLAVREQGHLDHFEVALLRDLNLCDRILLADQLVNGLNGAAKRKAITAAIQQMETIMDRYQEVWLRHNKKQNIETSLSVFEKMIVGLQDLIAIEPEASKKFTELDLSETANFFFPAVAGIPLGRKELRGIPFQFVPLEQTHVAVAPTESVCFPIAGSDSIQQIHLIYGGQTFENKDFADTLQVELLLDGKTVFSERLRNIKEICCWWSPMGEHMWAGGGYRHVDQKRNHLAIELLDYYGLMHLSGFKLKKGLKADTLKLRGIGKETVALFATTIERDV